MEGPIITEVLEKEGDFVHKGIDVMEEVSNILGESVDVSKESNVNIGKVNTESIKFGCERRFSSKKDGKNVKKKDRGGVGPVQDKMLFVYSRPSLR
ncbi:hypothetical protein Hanom_Chr04g00340181 [Helianthus anomalus]